MKRLVFSLVLLTLLVGGAMAQEHFTPVPPTGQPYAIIFTDAVLDGNSLEPGDEIGVYDGDLCVGALVVNGYPAPMTAWEGDPANDLEGFEAGNPIIYYMWDASDDREVLADAEYTNGNGNFGFGPYAQVALNFGEPPPEDPDIEVSAGMHDFGDVLVGDEAMWDLTISNVGAADLVISVETLGTGFSGDVWTDEVIAPEGEMVYTVTFAPEAAEVYDGFVNITTNDPTQPGLGIDLFGTGYEEQGGDEHFVAVAPTGQPYAVIVNEANIDGIPINEGDEIGIFDGDLCVGAAIFTEEQGWPFPMTAWEADPGNDLEGFTAGNPIIFKLWDTDGMMEYDAEADFLAGNGNFGFGPYAQVILNAGDVQELFPEIAVDPNDHYFGQFEVGFGAEFEFEVNNLGDADLVIDEVVINGDAFSGEEWMDFTIAPGVGEWFTVNFLPEWAGEFNGSATFYSNDPENPEVTVTFLGFGYEVELFPDVALNAMEYNFGAVNIDGGAVIWTLEISNNGDADLMFDAMLTGDWFFGNDIMDGMVGPGGMEEFEITFAPEEVGEFTGMVTITSNDPDSPELMVDLFGEGYEEGPDTYFDPVAPTGQPYAVIVDGAFIDGEPLMPGDEIGIFDGDLCVGLGVVAPEPDWPFPLIAWEGDPGNNLPGFEAGNPVMFLLWDADGMMEYEPEVEIVTGNGNFGFGPYAEFILNAGEIPEPIIDLYTGNIDFGEVEIGEEVTESFTFENVGNADLHVTGITVDGDGFSVDNMDFVVAPGETYDVMVTFAPTEALEYMGTVTVHSDAANDPDATVDVMGLGYEGVGDLQYYAPVDPTGIPYAVIVLDALLFDEPIAPGMEIGLFDGDLCVGAGVFDGNFPFPVTAWQADAGNDLPGFEAGNPILFGIWDGEMAWDAEAEFIDGNGTYGFGPFASATLTAGALPEIGLSTDNIDFGEVFVGDEAMDMFTIENVGVVDLNIAGIIVDGEGFWADDAAFTLMPGETHDVNVSFSPMDAMGYQGTVTVLSDADNNPEAMVSLMGTGIPVPAPIIAVNADEHDFGGVIVGETGMWTLEIYNNGDANLNIDEVVVTDGVFGGGLGATVVEPGGMVEVELTFAPDDVMMYDGAATIYSDDANMPEYMIGLMGEGLPVPNYFTPVGPTGRPYAILVEEGWIEGEMLMDGDEVGVFDGDLCVGAGTFEGNWPLIITAWEGDPGRQLPGFESGNEILYSMWNDDAEMEIPAFAFYLEGDGTFGYGPFSSVRLSDVSWGDPEVGVNPEMLNFGGVVVGESMDMDLTITNIGELPLDIDNVMTGGDGFAGDMVEGVRLMPEESMTYTVTFTPEMAMEYMGMVSIVSNDPFNPTFTVDLMGVGLVPDINLAADFHDFGGVPINTEATWNLMISNMGGADLVVSSVLADGEGFSIDPFENVTIAPDEAASVTVFFNPTNAMGYQGMLTILSNDMDEPVLNVGLAGQGLAPDIALNAEEHDFGGVWIEADAMWDLEVSNAGDFDLNVENIWVEGDGFAGGDFEAMMVEPGGSFTYTVTFNPMDVMGYEGMVMIQSDDPDEPELMVALMGNGLAPDVELGAMEYDFGAVRVGTEASWELEIGNVGSWDLTASAMVSGDGFTGDEFVDVMIEPDGTAMLMVYFMPMDVMEYSGMVTVTSNDPDEPEVMVDLWGMGVAPDIAVGDDMIDFGSVVAGQTVMMDLNIANDGGWDLNIGSIMVNGVGFFGEEMMDVVVAPGESFDYTVSFTPDMMGEFSGTVTIMSDDPDEGEVVVDLMGIGQHDFYFQSVPPTGLAYSIIITDATLDGMQLMPGDEVAVFDGDLCVGVSIVTGEWSLGLTAWQAIPNQDLPGFTTGHAMDFMVYSSAFDAEFDADADYDLGNGNFGFPPFSALALTASSLEFFSPVTATGNGYDIMVEEAMVDEMSMELGDEIGVFDGNLCVGAGLVTGMWPLTITAWEAVDEMDGFTAGNEMTFGMWTHSDGTLYDGEAEYLEGDGTFGFGEFTSVNLDAVLSFTFTKTIRVNRSELVSTYLTPVDLGVVEVFASVAGLRIVQNDGGRFYVPEYNVNTIGDIDPREGYRVFANQATEWIVEGFPLDPATEYTIAGNRVNNLGYPFNYPVSVVTALSDIVAQDVTIVHVQNSNGRFYTPRYRVNTIGDMQPTDGYEITVSDPVTFTFSTGNVLSAPTQMDIEEIPVAEGAPEATGLPYIVFVDLADELIEQGAAIIEMYDGNLLVGKGVVLEDQDVSPITNWGGDADRGLVGFESGNDVTYVVRDAAGEKLPTVQVDDSELVFGKGPYGTLSLEGVEMPTEFVVEQGYPNPFNPTVTVPFALPENGEVTFSVFNLLGQQVFTASRTYEAGHHRYLFDAGQANLVSGVYFLQVHYNSNVEMQKLLLLK
ncbi:choice-of-anchor D domain-containing protein [bacterium]|nr:choice-of-anchor D domain-containing protein [bacterium]